MRCKWPKIITILLTGILLTGCGSKETTDAWFEATDCKFQYPSTKSIECGYLHVPEDRTQENSPEIQLHVAIIKSSSEKRNDPVVVLQGGPGASALFAMDYWLNLFQNVLQTRDVIVFDQRGTGYSKPSLNCPEVENPLYDELFENRSTEEDDAAFIQAALVCQDRLIKEGVNLAAYTSSENAADVNDLRIVLGYPQWNLYGSSYGTRLALTIMRDHPHGVRSVILDSVYPPQANLYTELARNGERTLNLIFERCASDPGCTQDYPDLENVFYDLATKLDSEPVMIMVYRPQLSERYEMAINGDRFLFYFFDILYQKNLIPQVPGIIYELFNDRWMNYPRYIKWGVFSRDFHNEAMQYSVQCGEEVAFTKEADFSVGSVNSRFFEAMNPEGILALCKDWTTDSVEAIENKPVVSEIPTLILSGEFDPITPPEWGQLTAETLKNAQFFEFPGFSHGILGEGSDGGMCTFNILNTFLTDPYQAVDASCINDYPSLTFTQ